MNIEFNKNDGNVTIIIDGRLDTTTAPELENFLNGIYDGAAFFTFECEKLSYISSAGLRVLLTAHKKMKGKMKLIHVNELITEVLEMTGFTDVWVIE